jgi:hypothetical protein
VEHRRRLLGLVVVPAGQRVVLGMGKVAEHPAASADHGPLADEAADHAVVADPGLQVHPGPVGDQHPAAKPGVALDRAAAVEDGVGPDDRAPADMHALAGPGPGPDLGLLGAAVPATVAQRPVGNADQGGVGDHGRGVAQHPFVEGHRVTSRLTTGRSR